MRYEGNIFRPPSEAYSYILQVTVGCAHNACTFCGMYKDKQFRIRSIDEVLEDLEAARHHYRRIERVFLADGDAMICKNKDLLTVLDRIRTLCPECGRVGIYASAQDILRKSEAELKELCENGVGIAYMGVESGSAEILRKIRKGVTPAQMIEAGKKIEASGIKASVTFISGIGGPEMWREHAKQSARVISAMQPSYVGFLTLMVEKGTELYEDIRRGEFTVMSPEEVLVETAEMLDGIDVQKTCVFRSNHASNYLSLKGDLPRDKERMIAQIRHALADASVLKDERFRML